MLSAASYLFGYSKKSDTYKPTVFNFGAHKNAFCDVHRIANNILLYTGFNEKDTQTEIILFNSDLNEIIKRTKLVGEFSFIATLPDGIVLLRKKSTLFKMNVVMFDCNTLKIIDQTNDEFDFFSKWLPLEDMKFAAIQQSSVISNKDFSFSIVIHDLKSKKYSQLSSKLFSVDGTGSYVTVSNFTKLKNSLYACKVTIDKCDYFKVLIFDRKPGTACEFTLAHTMNLEAGTNDFTRGGWIYRSFMELPDGKLLTHLLEPKGWHFKIWAGAACVDNWYMNNDYFVRADKAAHPSISYYDPNIQILPMVDGQHLLFFVPFKRIFIFNMEAREMKALDIGDFKPSHVFAFPDGTALIDASAKKDSPYSAKSLLYINLKNMLKSDYVEELPRVAKFST